MIPYDMMRFELFIFLIVEASSLFSASSYLCIFLCSLWFKWENDWKKKMWQDKRSQHIKFHSIKNPFNAYSFFFIKCTMAEGQRYEDKDITNEYSQLWICNLHNSCCCHFSHPNNAIHQTDITWYGKEKNWSRIFYSFSIKLRKFFVYLIRLFCT